MANLKNKNTINHWCTCISPQSFIHSVIKKRVGTFLVSSQNPDLDIGFGQSGDGFRHSVLQLVLDGCGTNQLNGESQSHYSQRFFQVGLLPSTAIIAMFYIVSLSRSSRRGKVLHLPWGSSQSPRTLGREQRLCRTWPAEPLGVSWTRLQTRWRWCLCSTSTASSRWRWQTPGANAGQNGLIRCVSFQKVCCAEAAATTRHEGRKKKKPKTLTSRAVCVTSLYLEFGDSRS